MVVSGCVRVLVLEELGRRWEKNVGGGKRSCIAPETIGRSVKDGDV